MPYHPRIIAALLALALTLAGWAGALIIFAANVALALRRPAPAR